MPRILTAARATLNAVRPHGGSPDARAARLSARDLHRVFLARLCGSHVTSYRSGGKKDARPKRNRPSDFGIGFAPDQYEGVVDTFVQ
jgi:hypothetical protein